MAEIAVATALGAVQIMIPLLSELNLPTDVNRDIESMRSWLISIKAFMDHNYGPHSDSRMLDRLEKFRKIAYDIEDVVDEFILHLPPYTFHNLQIFRKIHTYAHQFRHHFPLLGISGKIERIRQDISQYAELNAVFPIPNSAPSSSSGIRVSATSPLLLDDEMVGYESPKSKFVDRLMGGERRLVKLAVDGPGGAGKTTFVKNVFWKRGLQAQYDCHAWVSVSLVSKRSDVEEISKNLLRQLCSSRKEPYPNDDGSPVQTRLRRYLTGKRYLVVLDDVRKQEDWISLKDAFPNSSCRSRIIITTRNSNISTIATSSPHDHVATLPGLEYLEGWRLFCRRAFPDRECPSDLKDTSNKILTRCEGLPLAIVTVASALALKEPTRHEWERFHANLGSGNGSNSSSLSPISNALLPSYMDLSSNLKCCFLYFSIFPEDYSVERGRLTRLWVAERFVVGNDDNTAEEAAEECLNELIQRNLVHVSKWDFDGRPKNVRVLNLVLKFIILRCKDENFASIFPRESNRGQSATNQTQMMIRRLSVHDHCKHFPADSEFAGVRSMFLLRLREITRPDLEKNLGKLKFVRVLEVQGAETLSEFPKEIRRFTLVRYLNFRGTNIKIIPSSIQKLSYLETLDLKQTDVVELPKEIYHLQNLTHLFVYKYNVTNYVAFYSAKGVKLHEGINKLTNLQSLSLVQVDAKGRILKELRGLTQLRKLGLVGLKREHGKDLCASLGEMKCLRTLDLCSSDEDEFLDLEEMNVNPPEGLHRLYLKGQLEKFPMWVSRLDCVMRVGLKWSRLEQSPLEILGRLRNLMELQLADCYTGPELVFGAHGFKKLKILKVECLENVHMMVIQNGAMSELKKMSLRKCPRMMMLLGVECLNKVEELTLYDMAEEFVTRLRNGGEDRDCVKHVPIIHSYTLRNQSWSLENLSEFVSPQ